MIRGEEAALHDPIPSTPRPRSSSIDDNDQRDGVALPRRIQRSVSYNPTKLTFEREHHFTHVTIAYHDDALPTQSLENIYRLLRAARCVDGESAAASDDAASTRVRLAKKILRYRRLLRRAEAVDLDDPAFDVNEFLRVTWCKTQSP